MLRCLVGDNLRSWDSLLCQAEFARNHANNRSLGFSPFKVVYGVLPRALWLCRFFLGLPRSMAEQSN